MASAKPPQRDAYDLILQAIDEGTYRPGARLVESELADRFGVSRTPIREALQRLETQGLLTRDGRSLIVASLDHDQMAQLYIVRAELEGLAARLAAQHAAAEEIRVLQEMVAADRALLDDPGSAGARQPALSQADPPCLAQQVPGAAARPRAPVDGADGDHLAGRRRARAGGAGGTRRDRAGDCRARRRAAARTLKDHLSTAFEVRLKEEAGSV